MSRTKGHRRDGYDYNPGKGRKDRVRRQREVKRRRIEAKQVERQETDL